MKITTLAEEVPKFGQYSNADTASLSNKFNGEGYLSIGGTRRIDYMIGSLSLKNKCVIDLGSGLGGPAKHLATAYDAHVTGIEVDPDLVKKSKKLIEKWRLNDRISIIESSFARLPFNDNSVDIIFSKEVIVHIINKQELFQELYRILKPGGTIIIMDWLTNANPISDQLSAQIATDALDLHYVTLDSYIHSIHASGLSISDISNTSLQYRTDLENRVYQLDTDPRFAQEVINEMGLAAYTKRYNGWRNWAKLLQSEDLKIYRFIVTKEPVSSTN